MKTKTEWFLYLPPAIAQKAIYNIEMLGNPNDRRNSLGSAISGGFNWSKTPEGTGYWASMCRGARSSESGLQCNPLVSDNIETYMIGYQANEAFKNEKISH